MIYGYVFAKDKADAAKQKEAFSALKYCPECIKTDYDSGKDTKRKNLHSIVNKMRTGDLLYIHSLDGLGDTYHDIRDMWIRITEDHSSDICVLDFPSIDTRVNTTVSNLVGSMLWYAEGHEKEKNRRRWQEGYQKALGKGVKFGRPMRQMPDKFDEIAKKWQNREITGTDAAAELNMPLSTFRYDAKKHGYTQERSKA